MEHIKEIEWLSSNYLSENVRILDCRYKLGEPHYGKTLFQEAHIPGAVYFDLEEDLSGEIKVHGGRHPLPDIDDFVQKLQNAGITNTTKVIAYDSGEGAFAARCWWMLKYLGHKEAFILNGGFEAWKNEGFEVSSEMTEFSPEEYHPDMQADMSAAVEDVRLISDGEAEGRLVDSRAKDRYLGRIEPIDKVAGHIPGAVNYDWTEAFKNGSFLSKENHQKRWVDINKDEPIIVYCGSGVTAAANILSLWTAGYKNAKLYTGSYSDWVSYEENSVETE
ncbi:sulfurtransferase [Rossellomorea vietnamensis]|uniref:Sulfurtransferase n=1 Tax=Rossellomorea vietnamensis TaxID=218284 RepID=A0A5D4KHU3_9BACI|nr:sulfurtransferase [Rossellomorea vietnamensis]TYR76526.1 sulfurtransferase [Rossellomorea vietnamensis]